MTLLTQSYAGSREKRAIAAAFGRAATTYDRHAAFQRDVGQRLLDQMPQDLSGCRVLDLGCGSGYFSRCLLERNADLVCADLSMDMLNEAAKKCAGFPVDYTVCDAEHLPFSSGQFDFVFSSLALQWCDDLSNPLKEMLRVLKPGGKIFFATLVDGSLDELNRAWSKVDSHQHVNRFITWNRVKLALAQSDPAEHHLTLQPITLQYASAIALMKDLKGIGATYVEGRSQGLISRRVLNQVESAYRAISGVEGSLPATYQVCFGVLHR